MMARFNLLLLAVCVALCSCSPELPEDVAAAYAELPDEIDFNFHVKPILSDKCFACHGPDRAKQKAGLRLDVKEVAYAELKESPGKVAIDPGSLRNSELFHRILSIDPEYLMPDPESHLTLSAREKAILVKWIEQGAEYKPHWAFIKPVLPEVPEVSGSQVQNPIDNFILDRLRREGLHPSPEAEKEILLRRVSLDLTGLPPTLAEIDAFLGDNSADAYEKQVDRLLASPHYGEKMAVDWLDVARFADSHGYTVDRLRDMSPYRDWVIRAFNENLPYDKFIQWQLAGDLMPDATKDMIIATAFNRNHQQNMEGGIVEEEFQTEYVVDRTNTFGDAFLGLPIGCARCHDHKYDPISQKEYYQLFSFFNNVREAGQISWNDAMPTPTMLLPTRDQEESIKRIKAMITNQEQAISDRKNDFTRDFERWFDSNGYKNLSNETTPSRGLIARYHFDNGNLKNATPALAASAGKAVNTSQAGEMRRISGREDARFEKRDNGRALRLNGDVWLDLKSVGVFRRSEPFTIGLWVNLPKELNEGVIFHKGIAERLYNFRGYHLYLKNDRLELTMAHTAPSNAITLQSRESVPRDEWIHLTATYDGSSRARGFRLYLNGAEMQMEVVVDQLTKEIFFSPMAEPGLQIGAWDRGFGLKDASVDEITVYDRPLTAFEVKVLATTAGWKEIVDPPEGNASTNASDLLRDYYFSAIHPGLKKLRNELTEMRTMLSDSMEPVQELMVMQEMPTPKRTFILERGNYDARGEEVFPNTPACLPLFAKDFPRNRYGLARWLTEGNHPLTARVAVNRLWQNFFGTGIVKTSEDFGNQGERPTHPELLDWLALQFVQSGWNVKALNKLIVMSSTYRQDSKASRDVMETDPDNRWLSRGPAFRLSAEMIRDNALAASGLLNRKVGGKSVKPYQPPGLWEINNTTYKADTGLAVYRRSLYVLVKRSVPNPTLATFDATSRSYCVVRRQKTNTPLQALVILNDPTFVEAARALACGMAEADDPATAIREAFRKLAGRSPSQQEVELLAELREKQLARFRKNPGKAVGWLNEGQHRVNEALDPLSIAANAVVASTILNSDAVLTKR